MTTIEEIISCFRLPIVNDYFETYLFPEPNTLIELPKDNTDNPIKHKKIIIFGDQGSGKTTLTKSLLSRLIEIYGSSNINALQSNSLVNLMMSGLDSRLVQYHVCEDYTLAVEKPPVIRAYFTIRKIWQEQHSILNGFILSVYNLHRFFSSMIEIRSSVNAIIFKNDSINPNDHSVIKRYLGDIGIDDLKLIDEYGDLFPSLKDYSVVHTRSGTIGLIKYPYSNIAIPILKNETDLLKRIKFYKYML